jgi:hypothetical protein
LHRWLVLTLTTWTLSACDGDAIAPAANDAAAANDWQVIQEGLDAALLSVWGTSSSDVWTVGGDMADGTGPLVLHYDGSEWQRLLTGQAAGTLWWVFGFEGGPLYMGGDGGVILRYEDEQFIRLQTPGQDTVFGIWGTAAATGPNEMWAVGGASESAGALPGD